MTIKQQGGIFGRNPTFNDVNVDGTFNGTSGSFSTTLDVSGNLTTYGENVLEGGLSFQRNYATWPYFVFSRAQGTRASPTSIGNGQTLSEIYFSGYTNGQYRNGAKIQAKVSAGVSGDEIPTTLTFSTTTDGANSPTDRWAINHTGNLVALQSGNGIDFSATGDITGVTSELLDSYEEGEFDVTLTPTTSGTITLGSSYNKGRYTFVGRLLTVTGFVIVDSVSSPVGNVRLSLPIAIGDGTEASGRIGGSVLYYNGSSDVVVGYNGVETNSYVQLFTNAASVASGHAVHFSITYMF